MQLLSTTNAVGTSTSATVTLATILSKAGLSMSSTTFQAIATLETTAAPSYPGTNNNSFMVSAFFNNFNGTSFSKQGADIYNTGAGASLVVSGTSLNYTAPWGAGPSFWYALWVIGWL